MKKLMLMVISMIFLSVFVYGQKIVDNFDGNRDASWYVPSISGAADPLLSYTKLSYVASPKVEGDSALSIDWSVHNSESYGGFANFNHYNPDSNAVYDFSGYDTLSFWYNNEVAQGLAGRVELRLNLMDVSDSPKGNKTYTTTETEYYYTMHQILDAAPGWHQVKIALFDGKSFSGENLNRTGWNGIAGNNKFDANKIKGWVWEFSISGAGQKDFSAGKITLDRMELIGKARNEVIYFNGKDVGAGIEAYSGYSGSGALSVDATTFRLAGKKSLKFKTPTTVGDGMGLFSAVPVDLGVAWKTDSLKFWIKADAGIGDLEIDLFDEDQDGWATGADFERNATYDLLESAMGYDGSWKFVSIPLKNLNRHAGGWNSTQNFWDTSGEMDSTNVKGFKINIKANTMQGAFIYLDDVWTGRPPIDVIAPNKPGSLSAFGSEYSNLITWTDVPGESGEVYNVYASKSPITDVDAPGVDEVKLKVPEGDQNFNHLIFSPGVSAPTSYYYAVTCVDKAGNISAIATTANPTVNNGRASAFITSKVPQNFVADGDLTEWAGIQPFEMKQGNGFWNVPANNTVTDDADLSIKAYIAMDASYLYVAYEVEDDFVTTELPGGGNSYQFDSPDLFLGFYEFTGKKHAGYTQGENTDHHFRYSKSGLLLDNVNGKVILHAGANYYWEPGLVSGYVIESRVPLDSIAMARPGDVIKPLKSNQRMSIDFAVNDADNALRAGMVTYSPYNQDQSWGDVSRWLYTWYAVNEGVAVADESSNKPLQFELNQNYPNPFNPTTTIQYSVASSERVVLKVYNVLGSEVATLVNSNQAAGKYTVQFDASRFASGVYFMKLQSGNNFSIKKMTLVK